MYRIRDAPLRTLESVEIQTLYGLAAILVFGIDKDRHPCLADLVRLEGVFACGVYGVCDIGGIASTSQLGECIAHVHAVIDPVLLSHAYVCLLDVAGRDLKVDLHESSTLIF